MNLILLFDGEIENDNRVTLTDYRADHIRDVLKPDIGDKLTVGRVNHQVGIAEVTQNSSTAVILKIHKLQSPPPSLFQLDLICALPRPQTVKKILFIAGMTSIRRVYFIRANRVEKSFYDSPVLYEDTIKKHLYDGMSQGKNIFLPEVSIHTRFRPFMEDELPKLYTEKMHTVKLLPHPECENFLEIPATGEKPDIVMAIGPEGGWVDFEMAAFTNAGFKPMRLSQHILRVEHAVMATVAQIEQSIPKQ